ncbi:MAG: prephenate dehydrogenase [Clostridia bacterium]|nr:prephenate dehydrogenase [Clostridia bacterium]
MQDKKITIIGLGLIGGSLARALGERLHIRDITAVNRTQEAIDAALKDGCISRGFTELDESIWDSDIIFICTPVRRAVELLELVAQKAKPGCIITDVGSTKAEIIDYISKMPNAPLFIGGHPMAGAEKTGYTASFAHLFENAYYILSPSKTSDQYSMDLMTELVKEIGAIPITLDAYEHDRITGCISHVPHIIASSIVNLVRSSDTPDAKMQMLAAGGFKDITRIASSSPEMWENIVISNKQQIEGILENYVEIINNFKEYIQTNDIKNIYSFFETAKNYRDSIPTSKRGLICPLYEIVVDVVDKPGIIGEIATILGAGGINIKNINVSNSREYEQGCLRITLHDSESVNNAFELLTGKGYKVYKR